MIWPFLVVVFLTVGGLFLGRTEQRIAPLQMGAVGLAILLGGGIYLLLGAPGVGDQPMDQRLDALSGRDPITLTASESLARLEQIKRDHPNDPQPHFFIGEYLSAEGRHGDAVRAYQSALRRDGDFLPALNALADTLTRLSAGRVGSDAKRLYARIYELDPNQLRAGFMVGYADLLAGEDVRARHHWQRLIESLATDDPRRTMIAAWIEAAGEREAERRE